MPRIQHDPKLLVDGRIEVALHLIHALRHKTQSQLQIPIQIIQIPIRVVHPVCQGRVRWISLVRDPEILPFGDIVLSNSRVVGGIRVVARDVGDLRHGADADDALEGEVGLVGQRAREVVGGDLVGGDQGFLDQVLGPLVEDLVVLGEIGVVVGVLRVGQRHDQHVAAFFQGLHLVHPVRVARGVGVGGADVVHGVHVGVLAGFLVDEEGVQEELEELRVGVEPDRVGGEDDIHGVDIAVRADFLQEEIGGVGSPGQEGTGEGLTDGKGGDCDIVGPSRGVCVPCDLVVESVGQARGSLEVGMEEGQRGKV